MGNQLNVELAAMQLESVTYSELIVGEEFLFLRGLCFFVSNEISVVNFVCFDSIQ